MSSWPRSAAKRRRTTADRLSALRPRCASRRAARGPAAARGRSRGRPQGRQAVAAQRLGAHVAGEQQPDQAAPGGAIALEQRHGGRYVAAKVTVSDEVTVDGTRQVWRLRNPTRLRLPVVLSVRNTAVRKVPQKRSGPKVP
jgi:putative intracellular protease/amidase